MFDLYIDPATGDLAYQNGGLSLVQDTNKRVRQELEVTLRAFKGEWFNNIQFGGINRDHIGRIGVTKAEVDAWYRRTILANPEVLELVFFESTFNKATRLYELEFVVRTAKGNARGQVGINPDREVTYTLPPTEEYLPPTTPSIKVMSAFIAGTAQITAILTKDAISFVSTPLAGTSGVTATAVRTFQNVTITGSGAITAGSGVKAMAASITASGAITANISTVMASVISGSSAVSGTVYKPVTSVIAGTSTVTGLVVKNMSSSISGSGAITATPAYGGSTIISGSSTVSASIMKNMVAVVAGTSTVSAGAAYGLFATIAGTNTVSATVAKHLVSTIAGTSETTASISKSSGSTIVGTSAVTANITKNFSAAITSVNSVVASINKGGSVVIDGSSTVTGNILKVKQASANISASGDITALGYKVKQMSSVVTGSSVVTATGSRGFLPISIVGTGTVDGTLSKRMIATIVGSGDVTALITTVMAASISGASSTTGTISKNYSASAAISGSSTVTSSIYFGPPIGSYDALVMSTPDVGVHLLAHEDYNSVTNGTPQQRRIRSPIVENNTMEQANTFYYSDGQVYRDVGLLRATPTYSVRASGTDNNHSIVYAMYTRPIADDPVLTFNMWVKTPTTLVDTLLFACNDGTYPASYDSFAQLAFMYSSTGQLRLRFNDNGSSSQGWGELQSVVGAIAPNTTYMLSFRFIGKTEGSTELMTTTTIWINGVTSGNTLVSDGNLNNQYIINSSSVDSGSMLLMTSIFGGQVGNYERASLFKRALTATEIENMYSYGNRTNYDFAVFNHSPVSYIRFEAHTDNTYWTSGINFSTGFSLSGSSSAGTFGTAPLTSGSRGGLTMGATRAAQGGVTLTNSNTLTINTWIKPTAVPPSLGFATITGITNNLDTPQWLDYPHFLVAMNENRQIVVGMWSADNTASITEVFTTQLVLNTTYQITVVYDYAATIKFRLFINGVESTSVGQTIDGWNWTTNGSLITTVQFVFHGGTATDSATSQFSGVIERTSIHSTALTQQEINTLYIQGTS